MRLVPETRLLRTNLMTYRCHTKKNLGNFVSFSCMRTYALLIVIHFGDMLMATVWDPVSLERELLAGTLLNLHSLVFLMFRSRTSKKHANRPNYAQVTLRSPSTADIILRCSNAYNERVCSSMHSLRTTSQSCDYYIGLSHTMRSMCFRKIYGLFATNYFCNDYPISKRFSDLFALLVPDAAWQTLWCRR